MDSVKGDVKAPKPFRKCVSAVLLLFGELGCWGCGIRCAQFSRYDRAGRVWLGRLGLFWSGLQRLDLTFKGVDTEVPWFDVEDVEDFPKDTKQDSDEK